MSNIEPYEEYFNPKAVKLLHWALKQRKHKKAVKIHVIANEMEDKFRRNCFYDDLDGTSYEFIKLIAELELVDENTNEE